MDSQMQRGLLGRYTEPSDHQDLAFDAISAPLEGNGGLLQKADL